MYLPMSIASASTIAVVILASVPIACLKKQTAAFKVFTHPRIVYIGLISYSLYLWHWGVLSISRWTIGIHWWSAPFQIALMFGLAVASHRWIETPLRKGNWFGKRWKTLVVGGGVLVTLSGGIAALSIPLKGNIYLGNKSYDLEKHKCVDNTEEMVPQEGGVKCFSFLAENSKKVQQIWILGDSIPGWERGPEIGLAISKELNQNTFMLSSGGNPYPPLIYTHDTRNTRMARKGFRKWDPTINKILPLMSKGDTVILINRTLNRFSDWEQKVFSTVLIITEICFIITMAKNLLLAKLLIFTLRV